MAARNGKGKQAKEKSAAKAAPKSSAAATVMARNNWPGDFKRAIRRKRPTGKKNHHGDEILEEYIDHTVVFPPGVAVEIDEEELNTCLPDIGDGKPLVFVERDEAGKIRVANAASPIDPNQIAELEAVILDQQDAIDRLIAQVKELGGTPVVTMDGEESDSVADEGTETDPAE